MSFQLLPLTDAPLVSNIAAGMFADITMSAFNRLSQDGEGRLVIEVAGADPIRVPEAMIVFGAFAGDFSRVSRQWYAKEWTKGQTEAQSPDCTSLDGVAPDATARNPQSATCKACPHTTSGKCGYRKDFVVYRVTTDASGQATVATDTPLTWSASSKSLFPEFNKDTGAGGVMKLLPLLVRKYGERIEGIVFNLGFYEGTKAPVIKPAARLPVEIANSVIESASSPEVRALLAPRAPRAEALPAPTRPAAPALPAPVPVPVQPVASTAPPAIVPAVAPVAVTPVVAPQPQSVTLPADPVPVAAPVAAAPEMMSTPYGNMTPEMFAQFQAFQAAQNAQAAQAQAPAAPAPADVVSPAPQVQAPVAVPAPAPAPAGRAAALAAFGRL